MSIAMEKSTAIAAFANVFSSISIVTLNKVIFAKHKFPFPTFMTLFHFAFSTVGLRLLRRTGSIEVKDAALSAVFSIAVLYALSIPLSNASLLLNSVGFYQLSKIAIAPMVAITEYILYKKVMSRLALVGLVLTCVGVTMATVDEIKMNFLGTVVAFSSSCCTVAYQLLSKDISKKSHLNGLDMVYHALPLSTAILCLVVPFVDGGWPALSGYEISEPLAYGILLSGMISLVTNWSMFALLGALPPLTYNILGHSKTVGILLVAFMFFNESLQMKKVAGIVTAVTGMIIFSMG